MFFLCFLVFQKGPDGLQPFDELVTSMVMKTLQDIYAVLKFDDLAHHPNSFLCRQTSFAQKQQKDKLNGDELKENVFSYFDERNDGEKKGTHSERHYESSTALSTMRSTQSETATFNNSVHFRQSVISHDSNLEMMPPNGLSNALGDDQKSSAVTAPKLDHQISASTVTVTVHPNNGTPRTPLTPMTQHTVNADIGSLALDKMDKFPAMMAVSNSESPGYHRKVQSLRSQLLRNSSINDMVANGRALTELSDSNSIATTAQMSMSTPPKVVPNSSPRDSAGALSLGLHGMASLNGMMDPLPRLEQSPSITNITGITDMANIDEFTPKEMGSMQSDDGGGHHHSIIKNEGNGMDLNLPSALFDGARGDGHDVVVGSHGSNRTDLTHLSNGTLTTMSTLDSGHNALNENINLIDGHNHHHHHHGHGAKGKRKKHFAASRQPSLPTLPEEHAQQKGVGPGTDRERDRLDHLSHQHHAHRVR